MTRLVNQTLTANGSTTPAIWAPMTKGAPTRGTFWAIGNFDFGTAELQGSPDGGVTWVNIPDASGTPVTFSSNGVINFELYANREDTQIRVVLAGALSPNLTIIIDDVN
ncbi:MAG: hypothetical protein ACW972_06665 [Promethearchaeota archaeon]|jgi:hypothetical protein